MEELAHDVWHGCLLEIWMAFDLKPGISGTWFILLAINNFLFLFWFLGFFSDVIDKFFSLFNFLLRKPHSGILYSPPPVLVLQGLSVV